MPPESQVPIRPRKWANFAFWMLLISIASTLNAFCLWGPIEIAAWITDEDMLVESMSAVLLFGSIIIGLIHLKGINRRTKPRSYYLLLWIILALVFLGEEVSWFQRIFEYSVPAVEEQNTQEEFNLHNLRFWMGNSTLKVISNKHLSDADRIGLLLQNSQNIFRLGFIAYFVALPLLFGFVLKDLARKIHWPAPDRWFYLSRLIVVFGTYIMIYLSPLNRRQIIIEAEELYYSLFIALYICSLCSVWPFSGSAKIPTDR